MDQTNDLLYWPVLLQAGEVFLHRVEKFYVYNKGLSALMFTYTNQCYAIGKNTDQCLLGIGTDHHHQPKCLIEPIEIPELGGMPVISVSNGTSHVMVLTSGGELYGWGRNLVGQVGTGNLKSSSKPVLVMTKVKMVKCADKFTAVLLTTGTVWILSNHWNGQLGLRDRTYQNRPIQIQSLVGVVKIACGRNNGVALTDDGQLYHWSEFDQIGGWLPYQTALPLDVTRIASVSLGHEDFLVQTSQGLIYHFWFDNEFEIDSLCCRAITELTHAHRHIFQRIFHHSERFMLQHSTGLLVWNPQEGVEIYSKVTSMADACALYGDWAETPELTKLPLEIINRAFSHDFNNPATSDFKICVNGKQIYLRKQTALESSPYLAKLFKKVWKGQAEVEMSYEKEDFKRHFPAYFEFLRFVMTGNFVTFDPETICKLLNWAIETKTVELGYMIFDYIRKNLHKPKQEFVVSEKGNNRLANLEDSNLNNKTTLKNSNYSNTTNSIVLSLSDEAKLANLNNLTSSNIQKSDCQDKNLTDKAKQASLNNFLKLPNAQKFDCQESNLPDETKLNNLYNSTFPNVQKTDCQDENFTDEAKLAMLNNLKWSNIRKLDCQKSNLPDEAKLTNLIKSQNSKVEFIHTEDLVHWPVLRTLDEQFLRSVDKFYVYNTVGCSGNNVLIITKNSTCFLLELIKSPNPRELVELRGKTVIQCSSGWQHIAVVTSDGSLYGWGDNRWNQLGTAEEYEKHEKPVLLMCNVKMVSCGTYHTTALKRDGTVWHWGCFQSWSDQNEELKEWKREKPFLIESLTHSKIVSIESHNCHSLALTSDSRLYYWGKFGGLQFAIPSEVTLPSNLINAITSMVSSYHGLMLLTSEGHVYHYATPDQTCPTLIKFEEPICSINCIGHECYAMQLESQRVVIWTKTKIIHTQLISVADACALYGDRIETPTLTILPSKVIIPQTIRDNFNKRTDSDFKLIIEDKPIFLNKSYGSQCSAYLAKQFQGVWKSLTEVKLDRKASFVVYFTFLRHLHEGNSFPTIVELEWICQLLEMALKSETYDLCDYCLECIRKRFL